MIDRRRFLRSAGGLTALALSPIGDGLFAATVGIDGPRLPLFTVIPYIQPGSASLLHDGGESMVVAWQTLASAADFAVEFGQTQRYGRVAVCDRRKRAAGRGGDAEARVNWSATLDGLSLGCEYFYRVLGNGAALAEGYFTTRQPRGQRIRFVAFGDNSYGDISDRAIAYHAYRQHPDFVMNCGDNVYESGTDDEYQRYFFPVYNADVAGLRIGAPLLRSIPFYTVIANHDVQGKDERDLAATDAFWTFVVFHHPPFNVGNEHYEVQHMRVLAPLFEAHGVDIVLSGHEHNYQRPRPIRFEPSGAGRSADVGGKDRRVAGRFIIDRAFDGERHTQADGVMYVVTGAGGKHLYDPDFTDNPSRWIHADDGHADYVLRMVTDRHSLSVFDIEGPRLTMTQIDEAGAEIDRMVVTKTPTPSASAAAR